MERRDFIKAGGVAAGAFLPYGSRAISFDGSLTRIPTEDKKQLADAGLEAARSAGASYADVRIGRYLNQQIFTREDRVLNTVNTESYGVGIRVIVNGTWGFSATDNVTTEGVAECARTAAAIARANSRLQDEPVQLAPVQAQGEQTWRTPFEKNAFEVPISEKAELLLSANAAAMEAGASFINTSLFIVNEQKYFASTDGSYIDQDVHRLWPTFNVTAVGDGRFQNRSSFSAPVGLGWEYMEPRQSDTYDGHVTRYGLRYDIIEDARSAAQHAQEKLTAESVEPGRYDLVLDPTHLYLTIHESVGHPLELDRVLGYEANYAGTSFATLDKWESRDFNYGSDMVNLFADKTQHGSLGYVGYDDEGVPTRRWYLVRDGVLVNYQAIRDQVHMIDQNESHGCCYAQNWNSVQFQRMPNVSLEAPNNGVSVDDMISGVERGIYIVGAGSYSIDQQRYNFQFGGQLFYKIENGEITGMLRDVAYQANTQEFWNSCSQICDASDYRLGGSFFDGKGQPSQISAVSHGSSTTRFDQINVINTARSI